MTAGLLASRHRESEFESEGNPARDSIRSEFALAIEIKLTSAPSVSKGFHLASEVLKPAAKFVVHGGDAAWRAAGGVEALPLADLMKRLIDTA